MKKLKQIVALLSLCAFAGAAPAQPQQPAKVVQDGIAVRPLSKWRYLAPEEVVDEQAAQQYSGLLAKASQQGALVPQSDPRVVRLRGIARRLIPFTPRWNADAANWKWQVNLLNSREVNAFCMPGGRIAFYTGIINSLRMTDDEIAAVMGHEIAHALREHGREQMGKAGATSIGARFGGALISSIFGVDPNLTNTIANYGSQMLALKYSRDDEREADLVGLDIAARAGFDPRAGVALWRKMAALNESTPLPIFSTHPGGPERIAQIESHMNVLLPLYAHAVHTPVDQLPPYRTNVALR